MKKTKRWVIATAFAWLLCVTQLVAGEQSPSDDGDVGRGTEFGFKLIGIKIHRTSPNAGSVYKEDVCYYTAEPVLDPPQADHDPFLYKWMVNNIDKDQGYGLNTFSSKFPVGSNLLGVRVDLDPEQPELGRSAYTWIVSESYKINYEIVSFTISSPTTPVGDHYIGTSNSDGAQVVVRVTLEGNFISPQKEVQPRVGLMVFWDEGELSSVTASGSYHTVLTENHREGTITTSITEADKKYPYSTSSYIQKAEAYALKSPNNVGGDYGLIDTKENP